MTTDVTSQNSTGDLNSPYFLFRYSIRTESTRKYYERRIKKFFDFIDFALDATIEKRCNLFAQKGKVDNNWAIVHIIKFLQYEKERVKKGDITAATLRNFVKSIKLYCEMSDVIISWKKITRGLPRARQASNDRAPTIEEIQQLVEYPELKETFRSLTGTLDRRMGELQILEGMGEH